MAAQARASGLELPENPQARFVKECVAVGVAYVLGLNKKRAARLVRLLDADKVNAGGK